ncbi:MAG: putative cytosol aminopeptidase [Micavibrio sp.]|nr:MAG: putative cytosol aminopeptidase [Micavibrio sp.]
MGMKITFSKTARKDADTAVIVVYSNKKLGPQAAALDKKTGGFIKQALINHNKFSGKNGETLALSLPAKSPFAQAVLLGLGDASMLEPLKAEDAGGKLYIALKQSGAEKVTLLIDGHTKLKKISEAELAAHIGNGIKLRSYTFDRYKSKKKDKGALKAVGVQVGIQAKAASLFKTLNSTAEGTFFARDLVNEPPNTLHPPHFAKTLQNELKPLGVEVKILDEKEMKKLGMGAILAVGMGSDQPPRMVIMRWKGNKSDKTAPVAFVGKGVTFDTGGISIKPAGGMDEMKMDMGGAAAVCGLMKSLALRKSKANVVGIVGLAENMPSAKAYRPGDIVKSLSGKTIEILNTDAEGRLVLADCLTYVQKTYKPRMIIDLATLTGAMMVALGHEYCGSFVNDNSLWEKMEKASATTGEKLWRMPLDPIWKTAMESATADLQNLGKTGRYAGACTAAGFLEHFIEGKTAWAHMDIAGTAWRKSDKPTSPKFGTGFGVRVLDRLVADHYEKK